MDELSEALKGVLDDPAQLAALRQLAGELLGGTPPSPGADAGPAPPQPVPPARAGGGNKAELVRALAPWLSPERGAKLQKALGMARAARLALGALGSFREGGHV